MTGELTDPDQEKHPPSETTPRSEGPPSRLQPHQRLRHRAHQLRLYGWAGLLLVALVVIIALIVDNTRRVKIGWVVGSSRTSLVWIILVAAIVGWLAGLATSFVVRRRLRRAMEP
jgi:uncharacterized integral membrane protein